MDVDRQKFTEVNILTFLSENDLTKHISIYKRLSIISLCFILLSLISLCCSILFLITKIVAGFIVCFCVFGLSIVFLVAISQYYKKETAQSNHRPYAIIFSHEFDFDEMMRTFSQLTSDEQCRNFQNESAFFCFLNKTFKNRYLLINMTDFDKSNFDSVKNRINKIINKEFHVSQWTSRNEVRKMMRTNIIITNEVNESLYAYLSKNAGASLRRAEGIINFAIVKDRLIIPPLYGNVDIMEVSRYKQSIKQMKLLLK